MEIFLSAKTAGKRKGRGVGEMRRAALVLLAVGMAAMVAPKGGPKRVERGSGYSRREVVEHAMTVVRIRPSTGWGLPWSKSRRPTTDVRRIWNCF
jgi:hypothetical protein